jgi:transcriptional regulator with XRE-family HTH domain
MSRDFEPAGSKPAERGGRLDQGRMGEHLRAARRAKGLSLRELSQHLGVSASLISQVETGRANPSVSTLYAIAGELDVSLDELLFGDRRSALVAGGDATPQSNVERMLQPRETRKRIRLASGVTWDRLTPTAEPDSEFLYVTYEVGGASSHDGFQRHQGHEWGYVIDGVLEVHIGFEVITLRPGDAISFDSTTPHRLANNGHEPVHGIWFVSGRAPSVGSSDEPARHHE